MLCELLSSLSMEADLVAWRLEERISHKKEHRELQGKGDPLPGTWWILGPHTTNRPDS